MRLGLWGECELMAAIDNLHLDVITDPVHDRVLLRMSCDVEFSNFEVNVTAHSRLRYRVPAIGARFAALRASR